MHCCKEMSFFIEEKKVAIYYRPQFREYAVGLRQMSASQIIHYCPWCGKKFPLGLDDAFFEEIEKLGFETANDLNLPEEFKTDEWWKKRGL